MTHAQQYTIGKRRRRTTSNASLLLLLFAWSCQTFAFSVTQSQSTTNAATKLCASSLATPKLIGGGSTDNALCYSDGNLLAQWLQQQQQTIRKASKNNNNNTIEYKSSNVNAATTDKDNSSIFQLRKEEWARKYTNVEALRQTFGRNHNVIWGDLDPATTRRLYQTLLPRALLELYHSCNYTLDPADLAPLAYRARVAAKLYARERSALPARIAANVYDGIRQWKKYGKFNTCGMSYEQVWDKYAQQIRNEECSLDCDRKVIAADDDDDCDDITSQICLKILEKSCCTNEGVDKLVLHKYNNNASARKLIEAELSQISATLERDVRQLLAGVTSTEAVNACDDEEIARTAAVKCKSTHYLSTTQIKTLKALIRIKKQLERLNSMTRNQSKSATK